MYNVQYIIVHSSDKHGLNFVQFQTNTIFGDTKISSETISSQSDYKSPKT